MNETHSIATVQYGDKLFTTTVTRDYRIDRYTGSDGKLIGEIKTYSNGSQETKGPYGNGEVTKYIEKDSQDVKITYTDENNKIYRSDTQYANDTFLVDFLNGTTSSIDSEGTQIDTDSNKTQTTYSNGTKIITTKIEPIQTITIHPDGTKITKFKKNGTVIEEDKYGGRIVKKDNNVEISYNDSRLNINANKWEIELGGDEDHHQEL